MSTTTRSGFVQPALLGGLVVGVLSALPIVSAGNLCCCLWVVGGGIVAAYVLQQNQEAPITAGDGALAGLLAGLVGAVVHLLISIPLTILMAPLLRQVMQRIAESGSMPPAVRDYLSQEPSAALQLLFGFIVMLTGGAVFSTLGGLLGSLIVRKSPPPPGPAGPATIDATPTGLQ